MRSGGLNLTWRLVRRALNVLPLTGLLLLFPRSARAEPQATAGLTIGAAGAGKNRELWDETLFHLGLRGDVLFGRDKPSNFAAGPYVELCTHAFREVQFGGGLSVLFPVIDYLPIVLSAGMYGRKGDDIFGVEAGVTGQLFWGTRSYNFHANYVMAAGLVAQMRYGVGASKETSIVIGAQLDLAAMSLPFQLLINAIRGGSPDTDPVEP